jgi:hypothetical protein
MAEPETKKPTCFIAMPISTPEHLVPTYGGDVDHFRHVLEELFIPAIEKAGMDLIPPISYGAENIHADIIAALQSAKMVLVDLSSLNPNVLFEFGVRTSLNLPACPVRDELTTKLPFDASTLNTHTYSRLLDSWVTKTEIPKLADHIRKSFERSNGKNALWKHFGFQQTAVPPEPPESSEDKLDLILQELRNTQAVKTRDLSSFETAEAVTQALDKLLAAWDAKPWTIMTNRSQRTIQIVANEDVTAVLLGIPEFRKEVRYIEEKFGWTIFYKNLK